MSDVFYWFVDSIAAMPLWLKISIPAALLIAFLTVLLVKRKQQKEKLIAEEKIRKMQALDKAISNYKKGERL